MHVDVHVDEMLEGKLVATKFDRKKVDGTCPISAEEEEALLQLAQQASLEEAAKRDTALKRLEARLACPWNLSICTHTDDQGNCQVRRSSVALALALALWLPV